MTEASHVVAVWRRPPWLALTGAAAGLAVAAAVPLAPTPAAMAGIATCMALWWLTEALPISATALLPLIALPALGLGDVKQVGAAYGHPVIFLFLGGFLLAIAMERCGLHLHVAAAILRRAGRQPRRLVLGFFAGSALLSMWISNTATTLLLLPIAMGVLREATAGPSVEPSADPPPPRAPDALACATMLAIAYGASIGGMATLVGTAPNLVLVAQLQSLFPQAPALGFGPWMLFAVPLSATMVIVGWALLVGPLLRVPSALAGGDGPSAPTLAPPRWDRDQVVTAAVFSCVAVLWVFGDDLRLGTLGTVPGWRSLTGLRGVDDGAVAIAGALTLFVLPSWQRRGGALLDWEATAALPWGLLLLFGGGFALADGFGRTGLSAAIGAGLGGLRGVAPEAIVTILTAAICALTELTSNTATASVMIPIAAELGVAVGMDPRGPMIAATLACSAAFMLPVATPPNAIVFASGWVDMPTMIRVGAWFNVLAVIVFVLGLRLLGGPLLGIDWHGLPGWAGAH